MKKMLTAIKIVVLLGTSVLFSTSSSANEEMLKTLLRTQNLTELQADLAYDAVISIKALGEEVQASKVNVQAYINNLMQQDQMDVDAIMQEYKQWQSTMDVKVETSLKSIAALHRHLSREERQALFDKLSMLSR